MVDRQRLCCVQCNWLIFNISNSAEVRRQDHAKSTRTSAAPRFADADYFNLGIS